MVRRALRRRSGIAHAAPLLKSTRARRVAPLLASLALIGILAAPGVASAQQTTFYLDRLQMAGAPDDGIGIWRPQIGGQDPILRAARAGLQPEPTPGSRTTSTKSISRQWSKQNGAPVSSPVHDVRERGRRDHEPLLVPGVVPARRLPAGGSLDSPDAQVRLQVTPQAGVADGRAIDGRVVIFRNKGADLQARRHREPLGPRRATEPYFGGDRTVTGALGLAGSIDAGPVAVTLNAGYH